MISYTRNLEDVMLQRVLGDVENGCYVDVGASHPVNGSNTYAFYQRGWRGIGIEPIEYRDIWDRERPEDTLINAAVGARTGEATFYIYYDADGISTCSEESMRMWKTANGKAPDLVTTVPVLTLNDVLARHLSGRAIHLMSIDVEGMEKEVLLGLDLRKYRPWVMIVEATLPGRPVASHHPWEPVILDAGYSMTYFDGLNRFYLARERQELSGRFSVPPNIWDHFVRASELESQKRISELEAAVRRLSGEIAARPAPGRGLLGWLARRRR